MGIRSGRVTEEEVAFGVLQIAVSAPDGIATFEMCRQRLPRYLNLSENDRRQSDTRPNEEMWHQLFRNIKSHDGADGNYIFEGYLDHVRGVGYKVTEAGRRRIKKLLA